MNIDANPKVLVWAREESGVPIDEVAKKIKTDIAIIYEWEKRGTAIPFGKLEAMAKVYKRQTAVFFLDEVPKKVKKPIDRRNLAVDRGTFSAETMLSIRRTERYLEVARNIFEESYWKHQYEWLGSFTGSAKNLEQEVRQLKEILNGNISARDSKTAFRKWKSIIEERLGIFVFQFSMPEEEIDGFSYAFDRLPYAIVVNNHNSANRKIFTLFHELAHILKHGQGACKTDFTTEKNRIEYECNNFAGKFLVSRSELRTADSIDKIYQFASEFNVSGETYLRRLFEEEMISSERFFGLLEGVKEKSFEYHKKKKNKKMDGGPSSIILSKSTRGKRFFEIVIDAASNNKISYSLASDLLGVKVGKL